MRGILGFFVFPLVGFVAAIVYVSVMTQGFGRGDLALAAAFVNVPVLVSFCGVVWVLLRWGVERRRRRRMGAGAELVLGLAVALVVGLGVAGPGGFTLSAGAELINVVLLVTVPLAILVYRRAEGPRGGVAEGGS